MGYGKTTAVNWFLAREAPPHCIRISVYSAHLAILWRSAQEAFAHAGFPFLRDYDCPVVAAGAGLLADGLCRGLAGHYDRVIIDCPAGLGRGFDTAVAAADRALVVTTPDTVCARDAQIVARLLDDRRIPSHLLINRLRPAKVMDGSMPDVDEIIDTAGIRLLGIVPEDEAVAVANANGRPLPADCHAALCFANIARRFLGESVPLARLEKM